MKQQSLFDNYFSEGALQQMISLRAHFCARLRLEVEVTIQGGRRCDLIIKFSNRTVVIEIKRIRLNALGPSESLMDGWPPGLPTHPNWYPEELIKFLKQRIFN